ncbi:MAG: HEPN domain-containing protein [Reinekea sp.]
MINTDLTHLPEGKQRTIGEIRRLILNEVEQRAELKQNECYLVWLVLFGSYARGTYVENPVNGYLSDYDILVAVHGRKLEEDLRFWNQLEEKLDRLTRTPINLIVHSHEDISQWLGEGQYFFSDIREQGIYLYSRNPKGMPQAKNLTKAEWLPIAQRHYAQWFESASDFIVAYDSMRKINSINNASFMLHQATERYFTCALLVLSNYRPHSHNLKMLRHLLIDRTSPDSPFFDIFAGQDRFQRRSFARLKRAYVDARYSEHFEITEEELDWLAGEVERLREVVKVVCEGGIAGLGEAD